MNATWDRFGFCMERENLYEHNILIEHLIGWVFLQMMMETWSGNNITTLKALIDGKLLTLNVLGQHLSLLETRHLQRKQTNLALEVWFGTNVEQGMLFQMTSRKVAIAPENLEIFNFFWISRTV